MKAQIGFAPPRTTRWLLGLATAGIVAVGSPLDGFAQPEQQSPAARKTKPQSKKPAPAAPAAAQPAQPAPMEQFRLRLRRNRMCSLCFLPGPRYAGRTSSKPTPRRSRGHQRGAARDRTVRGGGRLG